ncbi:hypothetical protein E2C01_051259 [Portunus trituberculatus]|uniref:Uncharacterized protein n=1 Tax=Portunus trituberculatus TaxID=210409 RepID=A0A5B7GE96_PORTR|nr:hypothetical protein [Portunus trituberculatus]
MAFMVLEKRYDGLNRELWKVLHMYGGDERLMADVKRRRGAITRRSTARMKRRFNPRRIVISQLSTQTPKGSV